MKSTDYINKVIS